MTTTLPDVQRHFQRSLELAALIAPATVLLLAGCSPNPAPAPSPGALSCAVGDSALVRETLYFGRNRPGGAVSDRDWNSFLADVVTPRFPQGLTVADAMGQWRSAGGSTVEQERSAVVTLFHANDEAARKAVQEIALEYKRRFQQEAVLRETEPTCVRFE
ncbi:MAG: DUF3574 domain-containing protein [Gemmatimonadales bacterium]